MKEIIDHEQNKKKKTSPWATIAAIAFIAILIIIITIALPREKSVGTKITLSANPQTSEQIKQTIAMKQQKYPQAIELVSPDYYHNLPNNETNITIQSLVGKKVILLDFWTYSCINCQRTLPYLNSWYDKYQGEGLEIIGIHTPEFEFEHDPTNVENALKQYGIEFPVVQDNEYQTWTAYNNHYWPHKYLIDIDGFVVYDHIGEGGYDETEQEIQTLLAERAQRLNQTDAMMSAGISQNLTQIQENISFAQIQTAEIYAGYKLDRGQFGNPQGHTPDQTINYALPLVRGPNLFYLSGDWRNDPEAMISVADNDTIVLTYTAKQINIVAGLEQTASATTAPATLAIKIDGQSEPSVNVTGQGLYTLMDADSYATHTIEITVPKGLQFYTFTFG